MITEKREHEVERDRINCKWYEEVRDIRERNEKKSEEIREELHRKIDEVQEKNAKLNDELELQKGWQEQLDELLKEGKETTKELKEAISNQEAGYGFMGPGRVTIGLLRWKGEGIQRVVLAAGDRDPQPLEGMD